MTVHKFRKKKCGQYRICDGKSCTLSEHVSYFWNKVKCKKCLALKGKK